MKTITESTLTDFPINWETRMPRQCVVRGLTTFPRSLIDFGRFHKIPALVAAIESCALDGDIYRDGEVWANTESLHHWLDGQDVETASAIAFGA